MLLNLTRALALAPAWFLPAAAGSLGLIFGSFLNVVVYRLPKMAERARARREARRAGKPLPVEAAYNLAVPRSACPHCGHRIAWYENVPVLSFLFLGGRCSACHEPISLRYPAAELAVGALFAACAWRWGATARAAAWCAFGSMLIAALLFCPLLDRLDRRCISAKGEPSP